MKTNNIFQLLRPSRKSFFVKRRSMKKIFFYIIILILITFAIPIFFANSFKTEQSVSKNTKDNIEEEIVPEYDYGKYNTIRLLHTATNAVEEIPIEEYLYGVVSAEMPANFEEEALKAQGIVARTYTMYKIIHNSGKHEGADICDSSSCCQAWISKEDRFSKWEESEREANWNKIVKCVNATVGKIITYEGEPINAFFHSNSGGTTEVPINVWGGSGYPYLQSVVTSGEEEYTQYSSEVELSFNEVIEKIKETHSNIEINFEEENAIQIIEYTDSGRVRTVKFGNVNLSGVEARSIFGLRSANFSIEQTDTTVKFKVLGYGHGVGMSQTGADSLAKQGQNWEEIVKHFYVGVEITEIL